MVKNDDGACLESSAKVERNLNFEEDFRVGNVELGNNNASAESQKSSDNGF